MVADARSPWTVPFVVASTQLRAYRQWHLLISTTGTMKAILQGNRRSQLSPPHLSTFASGSYGLFFFIFKFSW